MSHEALELKRWLKAVVPSSPFAGRAYLVGGCVRDSVLGLQLKDIDAVIEEPGGARKFAYYLNSLDSQAISQPHELGAGYPIWQLTFKDNVLWRNESFALKGALLEIADTQKEAFPDPNSRARVTVFGNLEEDCQRRDFSCNMLYYDLTSEKILDPSGRGLADIQAGVLRGHPQVNLNKIFSDDPLRMIRMVRFQGRFAWAIDPACFEAVRNCLPRLKILSPERVRDELIKMAEGAGLGPAFELFRKTEILNVLFPEFLPMLACEQDAVYHAEGDVWVHTLLVAKYAPRTLTQQLTAILHDSGKPATRTVVGERVKFLGHEIVSVSIAKKFLEKWKFPKDLSQRVLKLIAYHLRGGDVARWTSAKPARKLIRETGELLPELLRFIEADSSASLGPDGQARVEHLVALKRYIDEAHVLPPTQHALLNGHEIMSELGLGAGPKIKEVQEWLQEREDEWADEGRVLDKENAIDLIKQHFLEA